MFSKRAQWDAAINRLTEERARRGAEVLDLTVSNPTIVGLDYPLDELSEVMARAARANYAPEPLGLRSAREALAADLDCDAEDLVITASTSEAYSFLFKLLTDPGDEIVTATPTYPLLEHLTALELIAQRTFPLELHGRWHLHAERARDALTSRTRAIVVVNPNNPTGSYVRAAEQDALAALGVPIISDEVFFDYRYVGPASAGESRSAGGPPAEAGATSFRRSDVLTFTLGGLSKSAGLPHYKLAWIRVSGPEEQRRGAIRGLEMIADSFLSVSTPVQTALSDLLGIGRTIRDSIRDRCRSNLDRLGERALPVEGGWSAVIRVRKPDEELALQLLREQGVLVHPGYFFDFESDGFVVVSLLTQLDIFREGMRRISGMVEA